MVNQIYHMGAEAESENKTIVPRPSLNEEEEIDCRSHNWLDEYGDAKRSSCERKSWILISIWLYVPRLFVHWNVFQVTYFPLYIIMINRTAFVNRCSMQNDKTTPLFFKNWTKSSMIKTHISHYFRNILKTKIQC